MDFNYDTETITPDTGTVLTIGGTGALGMPVGTTAQQPGSAITGWIRYNTDNTRIEYYDGIWKNFASENYVVGATVGHVPLSGITAATAANSINNGDNNQAWNWALTTVTSTAFEFTENTAAINGAGAQYLVDINTLASSTANPIQISAQGNSILTVTNVGVVTLQGADTGTGSALTVRGGNATGSSAAVVVDSSGTNNTHSTSATTISLTTLTVGTGANRLLLALVSFGNLGSGLPSGLSIVWDPAGANQALTQVAAETDIGTGVFNSQIWQLVAPVSGNKILQASWTHSNEVLLGAVEFANVNQAIPIVTSDTQVAQGATGTQTVTVPSSTNDATVAINTGNGAGATMNKIALWGVAVGGALTLSSGANYALGGTSNVHTNSACTTCRWTMVGVHVQQASSTGGQVYITGGMGGSIGTGGQVNVTGGNGGSTSGGGGITFITGGSATTSGYGGSVIINGGNAAGTNQNGGGIKLQTGNPTGSGVGADITFFVQTSTQVGVFKQTGSFVLGTGSSLPTSATDGFLYIAGSAGTPAGIPTPFTGSAPVTLDTTNNLLYFYTNGAWRTPSGGGGSPAGSNTQIQYNNSGAFGASSAFTFDTTTNTLGLNGTNTEISITGTTAQPSAPASGNLLIYSKNIGGRMMPNWLGPAGVDTPFQPFIGFNNVRQVAPASGGSATTAMTALGTAFTNSGTLANPTPTSGSLFNQTRRTTFATSTTAGNIAYDRANVLECWRGNAAGLGGFFYVVRFGLTTLQSGNRAFFGLVNTISNPTNIDPTTSTVLDRIGMSINASTGNWQITTATAGGSNTSTDLGTNYPVDAGTTLLELVLFAKPNDTSITYRITNLTTGNQTTGTLSSNLPTATNFLAPSHWVTNNGQSAVATMALVKWYLETDY